MKNEVDFEGIIKVLLRWLKYIPSYPTFSARIVIKFWTRNYRSNLLNFREDFRFSGINIKKEEGERYTWKMNRLFANPNKAIRLRNDTLDYNSNKSLTFAGRMKWREGEGVAGAVSARQGRERRGWWVKLGGGREGGVGKRSLVKNTRVTRSFTRGATSVACWSRERERERGCFMAEHSLVIEYFGRGGNEERAALLLVACFRLAPLNVTISRTCSMRRHFYDARHVQHAWQVEEISNFLPFRLDSNLFRSIL